MKTKKMCSLFLIVVLCIVVLFTACGGGNSAGTPSDSSVTRTLRVGTTDAVSGFCPWQSATTLGVLLTYEEPLRRMKSGADGLENWLLTDIVEVDPTHYTMTLRDDITFSNGEQMLAEDILYTIKQLQEGSSMSAQMGCFDVGASTVSDDGLTLNLALTEHYSPMMTLFEQLPIVDKSEVENWEMDDPKWWDAPVGSGAYAIKENVAGSHTTFVRRDDYWNKDITLDWDEIVVNAYTDQVAMFIAFENNEIDIVMGVSSDDAQRLVAGEVKDMDTVEYAYTPTNTVTLFCMDPNKKEFQDAKVREAIANVIDRSAVGDTTYGVLWKPADSILSETADYYEATGTYDGGVEYAKECMAESAYPDGFDIKVVAKSADANTWQVIQGNLAEIGIGVEFQTFDLSTCIPIWMSDGGSDILIFDSPSGGPSGDPAEALINLQANGPFPAGKVLDKDYNEHWSASLSSTTEDERAENYAWIQQWCYDNFQTIPIVEPMLCIAWRKNVVSSFDVLYSALKVDFLYARAAE